MSSLSLLQEYLKPLVARQGDGVSCDGPELSVLFHCVSVSLALLSPIMPFISEELWQRLEPWRPAVSAQDSLCLQPYPSSSWLVPPRCRCCCRSASSLTDDHTLTGSETEARHQRSTAVTLTLCVLCLSFHSPDAVPHWSIKTTNEHTENYKGNNESGKFSF